MLGNHKFLICGNIIQFGTVPVRVDFINEIDGVSFDVAEKRIVRGKYGKPDVNFIGKTDLIKNKKAAGRPQESHRIISAVLNTLVTVFYG